MERVHGIGGGLTPTGYQQSAWQQGADRDALA